SRGRGRATARRRSSFKLKDPARLGAGLLAIACAAALVWLVLTTTPVITAVDVAGARHVRVTQAIAQSELLETPSFRASAADARTRLRSPAAARGELRADATGPKVVMTSGANGLVLRFTSWEIRFGGPESFDDKLAIAKRYLRDNPTRRLDYVDVRSADRIVVSPQ